VCKLIAKFYPEKVKKFHLHNYQISIFIHTRTTI